MPHKPADVGNGAVNASFGDDGSWLSAGFQHPEHGLLLLTATPPFDVERDGDGTAVRAARVRLTDPAHAVLRPVLDGGRSVTSQRAEAGARRVVQQWRVEVDGPGRLRLHFRGRVDRPDYAEITPGGPIPPRLPASRVRADAAALVVDVPGEAGSSAALHVRTRGAEADAWTPTASHDTADGEAVLEVTWGGSTPTVEIEVAADLGPRLPVWTSGTHPQEPADPAMPLLDRIAAGARRYTHSCTAVPLSAEETCIITDHRLLPLSWTRDAYYQAGLLLSFGAEHDVEVVRRHLAWLWGPGRDSQGIWHRSHFVTGAVKDYAYQVDQQLYPMLELVDFRRVARRWPDHAGRDWGGLVRQVWTQLPRDGNGLVPGEENPADDPCELPYLLSSQLLVAYAARRLAEFDDELGVTDLALDEAADRLCRVIDDVFACQGPFGTQWAYESDGMGGHRLYQDANDVPTALAALWGLYDVGHVPWRNTMRYAFSDANPGFVPGRLGGLGSLHTPGVWPLGDAQEWIVAALTGSVEREQAVLDRWCRVVADDGMLPETYDPDAGEWLARHWFAWPGSLVGLLGRTARRGTGPW